MNEKPILFSGEMVRKILDGSKTQTRRVVKRQPNEKPFQVAGVPEFWIANRSNEWVKKCPYGKPGDLLWVRETFCVVDDSQFNGLRWVDYKATPKYEESHPAGWDNAPDDPEALKWKPSIHMPRWASRITLRVTGVRVERVQDISLADIAKEGVTIDGWDSDDVISAKWIELWDSINAKRGYGWDSNPWVWVVEFEKV